MERVCWNTTAHVRSGGTDNIHVLIVQYGLRVEIQESKKRVFVTNAGGVTQNGV